MFTLKDKVGVKLIAGRYVITTPTQKLRSSRTRGIAKANYRTTLAEIKFAIEKSRMNYPKPPSKMDDIVIHSPKELVKFLAEYAGYFADVERKINGIQIGHVHFDLDMHHRFTLIADVYGTQVLYMFDLPKTFGEIVREVEIGLQKLYESISTQLEQFRNEDVAFNELLSQN